MSDPVQLLAAGLRPPAPRPQPTPSELSGILPAYDVESLIGSGGMGAVYRAHHRPLDRPVALKVLLLDDPAAPARFGTEARALARLDHPHIVHVFDVGEVDGLCWLAMELVDGVNLRQAQRERRLDPSAVLALVPQLCSALQYAHDAGVVHRDIKPENILIDRQGQVRIADFGVARIINPSEGGSRLTGCGAVMGTPHYMAPEQVENPQSVDHRADLYALGVVLYELLTGELPLGRFSPPSRTVGVDARLDEVIFRALEKNPERRYQQAQLIGRHVERIVSTTTRLRWPWLTAFAVMVAAVTMIWWSRPHAAVQPAPGERPTVSRVEAVASDLQRPAAIAAAITAAIADASLMRDEQFTALVRRFDGRLRDALGDVGMAQAWRDQVRRHGGLEGVGPPRYRARGDGHEVRFALRWPDGADDLLLVYDHDLHLSGLWITSADPYALRWSQP